MKIAIGSDHAGFHLKQDIIALLTSLGHQHKDFGAYDIQPSDYPDYVKQVADAVVAQDYDLGIFICGTGIGPTMAANKIRGIRAAVCHDTYSAHQSREHSDANVLCLGAKVIGAGLAADIVETWLKAGFSGEERHQRRIDKMMAL
ncbi:MAG: ribose 5-phosphate isomerase B [Chloroflexi bacterium]|nr:ribose 5-phosphate isomerase B [Chloroflexota bacterium]